MTFSTIETDYQRAQEDLDTKMKELEELTKTNEALNIELSTYRKYGGNYAIDLNNYSDSDK